jgi:phospholipase C
VAPGAAAVVTIDTKHSSQWYDLELLIPASRGFQRRFAGRVETGKWTMTDPAIGRERRPT